MMKKYYTKSGRLSIQEVEYVLPSERMSSEEISLRSGVDKRELNKSFGEIKKPISLEGEGPISLAIMAVERLFQKHTIDRAKIRYIIYASSGINDYQLWSPAAKIQAKIKAENAVCFEVANGCNSLHAALHLIAGLLGGQERADALLVLSDTLSKFVDYSNPDVLNLFSFSDGAAAIRVNNYSDEKNVVSSSLVTDGSYADVVKLPYGGVHQLESDQQISQKYILTTFTDNQRSMLYKSLVDNYIRVISNCLSEGNVDPGSICYFLLGHNSSRVVKQVLAHFGVHEDNSQPTMNFLGHMGSIDTVVSLSNCLTNNSVHDGDYVIIAGAGVGYHWGAHLLRI